MKMIQWAVAILVTAQLCSTAQAVSTAYDPTTITPSASQLILPYQWTDWTVPIPETPQPEKPKFVLYVICGCAALAMGAILYYKICQNTNLCDCTTNVTCSTNYVTGVSGTDIQIVTTTTIYCKSTGETDTTTVIQTLSPEGTTWTTNTTSSDFSTVTLSLQTNSSIASPDWGDTGYSVDVMFDPHCMRALGATVSKDGIPLGGVPATAKPGGGGGGDCGDNTGATTACDLSGLIPSLQSMANGGPSLFARWRGK